MLVIVAVVGVLIVGIGVVTLIDQTRFTRLVAFGQQGRRLYGIAVIRLVLGVLFVQAAPDARLPLFLQVLGLLMLVAAVAAPVIGLRRLRAMAQWAAERPPVMLRVWSLVATALGALVLYAAV